MKKLFYLTILFACFFNNVSAFKSDLSVIFQTKQIDKQFVENNSNDSLLYEVVMINVMDEDWVSFEKLANYIEKVTGLGKEQVANLIANTPSTIKKGISKEEADDIRLTLIIKGGEAVVKATETSNNSAKVDVVLKSYGNSKLAVVKALKEETGVGLSEAMKLVGDAPSTIKKGISMAEAEKIKTKLELAGGTVEVN